MSANDGESAAAMDMRLALNAQIKDAHANMSSSTRNIDVAAKSKTKSVANSTTTEWNVGVAATEDDGETEAGGLNLEHWPSHLPRPPSRRRITEDPSEKERSKAPKVIVFNANTQEGSSLVRVLSDKGLRVVTTVRIVNSRTAKRLAKLKGVMLRVADLNNHEAVIKAATGCSQAFLVTKYWERFENPIEEDMAKVVLEASAQVGIQRFIMATFEDTSELRLRGRKSQLQPTKEGLVFPAFDGMKGINALAASRGVDMTHMFTSYLDVAGEKKSLILIRAENGKIMTQDHFEDTGSKN